MSKPDVPSKVVLRTLTPCAHPLLGRYVPREAALRLPKVLSANHDGSQVIVA